MESTFSLNVFTVDYSGLCLRSAFEGEVSRNFISVRSGNQPLGHTKPVSTASFCKRSAGAPRSNAHLSHRGTLNDHHVQAKMKPTTNSMNHRSGKKALPTHKKPIIRRTTGRLTIIWPTRTVFPALIALSSIKRALFLLFSVGSGFTMTLSVHYRLRSSGAS